MCYVNGIRVSRETFVRYKQQQKELNELHQSILQQPVRRGFDYSDWPIIKPIYNGNDWKAVPMQWGFLPSNIKDQAAADRFRNGYKDQSGKFIPGFTTLNIVGEEILQKTMFRESALQRRCLVLSSGFYEHRHVIEIGKRGQVLKTPVKYPYHVIIPGKEYFFMAGVYNTWTDQTSGHTIDTFAIITTDAQDHELMSQVHNSIMRMPVILTDNLAEEWTDNNLSEQRITEIARFKYPSELMIAYQVPKDILKTDRSSGSLYSQGRVA